MPPKKRLRGPKLPTVREDSVSEPPEQQEEEEERQELNEEFGNEHDEETESVLGDVRSLNLNAPSQDGRGSDRHMPSDKSNERRTRKMILEAIRQTFQSRGNINQDINVATQKMLRAYGFTQLGKKSTIGIFINEVDIRLTMMLEEISVVEHRARVFKMIALAAVEIFNDHNDESVLRFLLDFFDTWGRSDNVAARINTASFVSYMLETGNTQLEAGVDKFCGFSLEDSEKMFCHLKRALLDKEFHARVPAIRGMGYLQKHAIPSNWGEDAREHSPRELLTRSFRDTSWECRLVAMQSFLPKESDVEVLSDIVYYDKCLKVRVAALDKFGDLRPNKHVREKIAVLDLCFKDHEVAIRDMAKDVIKRWVTKIAERWTQNQKPKDVDDIIETDVNYDPLESQENKSKGYILSGQALVLLWLSDNPETAEHQLVLKRIVVHLLDVIRQMYICQQEPVNVFADVIMNDLRDKMIEDAVPIITKSTIGSILEGSELLQTIDAQTTRAMVFFWRCIVEYMADRKRNEGDKANALMRFICPLKTMVEHLIRILHRVKDLENQPHQDREEIERTYVLQMSIVEHVLLVMRHAQSEQAGLDAYRSLLTSMLMNVCYQKKIVDIVVGELSQFYVGCADDLFSMIYARTNEMRQKTRGGKLPQLDETILVGEAKVREQHVDEARQRGRRSISDASCTQIVDLYDLMVLNSAMKTGILKEWSSEYRARYAKMFLRGMASKDLDTRILTVECVGIVGMYDLSAAENQLGELIHNFRTDQEGVRTTLITALTDLSIQHGLDEVDFVVKKHCKEQSFLSVLTDIIISEEPRKPSLLLLQAVEGLSKIFLHVRIDPESRVWQKAMVALMFRASYTITDRFSAKIRSTIIVMLKFFCSLSKNNQSLLVKSFRQFFEMWSCTSNTSYLTPNPQDMIPKLKRCAAAFVALTRHSTLPMEEQKRYQPTHVELVNDIMTEVAGRPDSMAVDYYLYALHCIEYESFTRTSLNKIYGDLESYVEFHEGDTDRQRYNELRRVSKKVAKLLGINENDDDIEEIPPSRAESRRDVAGKKGRTEKKKQLQPVDEVEEEMPEEATSPKPVKKTRVPRSAPASAAKKKKDDDALDLIQSPQRNPRKPPSRPTTATKATPSTSAARTAPPRSSRRLRSDK